MEELADMTERKLQCLARDCKSISCSVEHPVYRIFTQFASLLEKLAHLRNLTTCCSFSFWESLSGEIDAAESILKDISGKSRLYMLICFSTIVDQVRKFAKETLQVTNRIISEFGSDSPIGLHAMGVRSMVQGRFPEVESKDELLCNAFQNDALDSIGSDHSLIVKLAEQIADSLGMTLGSREFSQDLEKLRGERRGKLQSLYLDQFVVLLDKALKKSPAHYTEDRASSNSNSNSNEGSASMPRPVHRDVPMLPLQSFICLITREVMRDPVQIASGQSYERSAIECWFAQGHTRCPTGVPLKNTKMKPNYALKQSIAEWRERNYAIRLDNVSHTLTTSQDVDDMVKAVQDLQALCEEDSMNKYEAAKKNLIPLLINLTTSPTRLATHIFSALTVLAKDHLENQETMANNAIVDMVVNCLAQQKEESLQAVYLLRLLSENKKIAEKIGHTRNAILFLVTLMQENQFTENIDAILDNLPKSDTDVITMAEANIMKPLLMRLLEGELSSKILMSKTLGRLHMPVSSKESIATTEIINLLLEMTGTEDEEVSTSAIAALQNLSSVPSVCKIIENANGVEILLSQLKRVDVSQLTKSHLAHVLSNLFSKAVSEWTENCQREKHLTETISVFMSLMHLDLSTDVQYYLLQALIALVDGKLDVKRKMVENNVLTLLVNLWEKVTESRVKTSAVQLFSRLSGAFGVQACSTLKEKPECLNLIFEMLKDSYEDSDQATAASILADLPPGDKTILSELIRSNAMPQLVKLLDSVNDTVVESSIGALLRFCMINEHKKKLAEMKVIPKMVTLLNSGSSLAKERAAKALYYFSKSTLVLCKKPEFYKCLFCFSPPPNFCKLHHGLCQIESCYCLLEARAVRPLVMLLKEQNMSCVLAALNTLGTLVDDSVADIEEGWRLIDLENGIIQIITLISSGTPEVETVCANFCERIFKVAKYRNKYGMIAQMHIISLAQRGSSTQKQIAGRILRQLDILESQSNYFSLSTVGNP